MNKKIETITAKTIEQTRQAYKDIMQSLPMPDFWKVNILHSVLGLTNFYSDGNYVINKKDPDGCLTLLKYVCYSTKSPASKKTPSVPGRLVKNTR